AGGYTPSDFPLAHLSQQQLDALVGSRRDIEAIYPLSPLQQGLLFQSLYAPQQGDYITQVGYTLQGDLNVEAFEQAWQQVINEYAILRTALLWEGVDEAHQVVSRRVKLPFSLHDWRHCSPSQQQERLALFRETERRQGFDLSQPPLLRITLFRLDEQRYECLWSHHHLLLDGWSLPLVLTAVFRCYQACSRGQVARLPAARPYQDYIDWLARQDLRQAERFWREFLAGFPTPNRLRNKHVVETTAASSISRYGKHQQVLPATLTSRLQRLAREEKLTLNTLMQGAWALLVSRYSGQEEVVFGVTVAGRTAELAGIEQMVGLFINTLPLRIPVPAAASLLTWLQQVQQRQRAISQYEYSPLAQVQGWSEVPHGVALFESLLVFENYPLAEAAQHEEQALTLVKAEAQEQTHYPLTLYVLPGQHLGLQLLYSQHHWSDEAASRLLEQFQHLLQQ